MGLFIPSVMLLLAFPCAISHVVVSFQKCATFFKESQPPQINGILKDSKSLDEDHYKCICQKKTFKSGYTYATLYNTAKKIPVFSAYKYTGKGDFKREKVTSRMIEPQLEPDMIDPFEMTLNHQATDSDYSHNKKFDLAHLFPSSYAKDSVTYTSTFTLTNIVPQYKGVSKFWTDLEEKNVNLMNTNCLNKKKNIEAYVLAGAVHSNIEINSGVPSMLWTAFCCFNKNTKSWISKAHWALNEDEKKKNREATEVKLEDLVKKLKENNLDVTYLFKNNCS